MTAPNPDSAGTPPRPNRVLGKVLCGIEILVLVLVLAGAWKVWSLWPTVPFSDPDTWGYLNPALCWLSGLGFRQTDGRDWFYPAQVALFLKLTGSFNGLLVCQKIVAVLAGILMGATWRAWLSMLPFHPWLRFLFTILGAVPIYIQLVNQQSFAFVMSIRPEAVLWFFVYAQLACLMGYCKYRWQAPRAGPSMIFGAVAIALAYACFLLKPSWYFAFGTTAAPVLIGVFGRALSRKVRLLTPVVGAVVTFLLLSLPSRIWFVHDGASATFLPDALFCVHAQLIDKLLHTKLEALPNSSPDKPKLQALITTLEDEIKKSQQAHVYTKLKIDADSLMHSKELSEAIYDYAGRDRKKFSAFCFASFFGAVAHYPREYAQKFAEQFEYFVFPASDIFLKDQFNLIKPAKGSDESMAEHADVKFTPEVNEMVHRYRQDIAVQVGSVTAMPKDRRLHAFGKSSARWVLPLELVFFVVVVVAFLWPPLHPWRVGGWAAICLYLAPFGNAFGVCIVHTLDIFRYRVTYGGYLLTALSAMAVFTVSVLACSLWQAGSRLRKG